MQACPLLILNFQQILGLCDVSSLKQKFKSLVSSNFYLRNGYSDFLREILPKFQVALVLDVTFFKDKINWAKSLLLDI
jgi:hypothetical protein